LSFRSSREVTPVGEIAAVPAKQRRSQITHEKLIEAGFELLEHREFDAIPVAEIAERAGYSVGAFYARFKNKDDFHGALVRQYASERLTAIEHLFAETSDEQLISTHFRDLVTRLWRRRYFWRANLFRSIQDPPFWEPFRQVVRVVGDGFVARAAARVGRELTTAEELDIRFALQVANGTINNQMINRPGPISVEDPDFIDRIERVFRLVSRWDELR
jgi:AcrR family transcriptional regulator